MARWSTWTLATGLAVTAGLCSTDARAQLYLGAEGGWTSLTNTTDSIAEVSNARTYNDGYNVGVRGGYQWGPWRFEEEYSYRENGNSSAQVAALFGPGSRTGGNRSSNAIMTNAIYDFNLGWAVTPHLGVGIGAVELNDSLSVPGAGKISNSSDWEFGYQAIAGARYNITPSLVFDLDYRYLGTTDGSFTTSPFKVGAVTVPSTKYSSGYGNHNIVASLTWRFGAAPEAMPVAAPMPPAPPPPAPHQVFLVFFDWDRDVVTPAGMAVIEQAANAYRAGTPVQLQVTGYTDRSGSPAYNQRLSERRANNVANALTQRGVPRDQMTVNGRGENDNRVPTADGVREPQNRRVEIVTP